MTEITSKELALAACKALADKRGRDIVTLYVREKTALCDYFGKNKWKARQAARA